MISSPILEKRQQDQLKSWTNSISFIDDKYDNNTQRIRNDSNDLDISEIGDDIKNMNYLQNDIRKLFLSSEGRKQITTELIAKKWNLHNNNNNDNNYDCDPLEMNYNETPISEISRSFESFLILCVLLSYLSSIKLIELVHDFN